MFASILSQGKDQHPFLYLPVHVIMIGRFVWIIMFNVFAATYNGL